MRRASTLHEVSHQNPGTRVCIVMMGGSQDGFRTGFQDRMGVSAEREYGMSRWREMSSHCKRSAMAIRMTTQNR
jgi:hypothetical protein